MTKKTIKTKAKLKAYRKALEIFDNYDIQYFKEWIEIKISDCEEYLKPLPPTFHPLTPITVDGSPKYGPKDTVSYKAKTLKIMEVNHKKREYKIQDGEHQYTIGWIAFENSIFDNE